jgi:hypothetical protein
MTTVYEIPLVAAPQRRTVSLAGVTYSLVVAWNAATGGYVLDIADSDGAAILSALPLVTGVDLLAPYAYLGLGGALYVQTDHDPDVVPAFDTLGAASRLYWVAP